MGTGSPHAEGAVRQVYQDAGKSLTVTQTSSEKLPKYIIRQLFCLTRADVSQPVAPTRSTVMIPECDATRKGKGIAVVLLGVVL